MSEQSRKSSVLTPAAELEALFSGLDNPNLQPPLDVEQFRDKESHSARARRLGHRAIHGRYSGAAMKPARYDTAGYVDNVAKAIDALIAERSEFPEELYGVAETAAAAINQEKRDYGYFSDDPQGVEALGLLKAIISRPVFIMNPRAEEVLSKLGQATHQVCEEDMFIDRPYGRDKQYGRHPKMKDGHDVSFTPYFQRIATSDVLWDKVNDSSDNKWPLIAVASALETLAVNHPIETQEARLAMLKKDESSGSHHLGFHLIYSFNTDEEKAFLADAAAQDVQQKTGSRVAQDILDGRYHRVMWA